MFNWKTLSTAVLAAAMLATAAHADEAAKAAPAAKTEAAPDKAAGDEVIATVGGRPITRKNLDIATANILPLMSLHSNVSDEKYKRIQRRALTTLIENELLYLAAVEDGTLKASDAEIDAKLAELKKGLPKDQTLEEVLKRSNMTLDDLRSDMRQHVLVQKMREKKIEDAKKEAAAIVTEQYMKNYYDNNIDKFKEPEQLHLSVIHFNADPGGGDRVWGEVHKRAKEVTKKARAKKADFAALAKQHSEDPSAEKGGDVGWAHRGSLNELEEALSKMKPGDVSDPVQTLRGFVILKLHEIKPSVLKKYEDLNLEKLKKELEEKELRRLAEEWLAARKAKEKVEFLVKLD